jgi:redox-sensitive bicupin YhaK (pirin superfamily)
MRVPGHPHTGLQTVSWLFSGKIEHRDTAGNHALVRPGELNLMTAGTGIAHSEYSTADTTLLHGAQLWVALPEAHRFAARRVEHYAPPVLEHRGARVTVFLGSLAGASSPVATYSPLLGAEITLRPGSALRLDVEPGFEHGVLVDTGTVTTAGNTAETGELVYQPTGAPWLELRAGPGQPARVLLLGGQPLGEQIVMWWNFIARSHQEIIAYRQQWQAQRAEPHPDGSGRYGPLPQAWEQTLPAPDLPNTRLKPRG